MPDSINRPTPDGEHPGQGAEFRELAAALDRHQIAIGPNPDAPDQWVADCPRCLTQGLDGAMRIFMWELREHASKVAFQCERHSLYEIGTTLGIRTTLMEEITQGRFEVGHVLAALDKHELEYNPATPPEGYFYDFFHTAQCPLCVKQGKLSPGSLEICVDTETAGDNSRFGHVTISCNNGKHREQAILDELNVITRISLKETYGAIDWSKPVTPGSDWLIEPLIERGQFAVIYGPAGSGKSLYAQEQAFQLAEQGLRVLYIDHENTTAEVAQRKTAMGYQGGSPLTYLNFPPIRALDTAEGAARLDILVDKIRPDVVFLDTWSKFLTGNESSPSTHTAAYNLAIIPLRRRGITVIAIDHSGKDIAQGPRGGSTKVDNADVLWLLTAKSDNRLRLERRKTRTGRGPDLVELERHENPLRHERPGQRQGDVLTPDVRDCIAKLDELEVPPGWGRRKAAEVLRVNEYKIRNDTLNTALRIRRERGNAIASTLDLPGTAADRSESE